MCVDVCLTIGMMIANKLKSCLNTNGTPDKFLSLDLLY